MMQALMPRKRTTAPRSTAFTLIELLVVVAIIGLLGAIALPRFSGSITHRRAQAAARRIAADLELASRQAVHSSSSKTVTFTGNSYTLAGVGHLDRSGRDYQVDLSAEPYQASIVAVDFDGDAEVIFDIFGVPDSGGSVLVQVGHWQREVTLDAETGRTTFD